MSDDTEDDKPNDDNIIDFASRKHSTTKEKSITHQMENTFNIAPGTTVVQYVERPPTVIVKPEQYDNKDLEIDEQYQEVYDLALDEFNNTVGRLDGADVDPKYFARTSEMAAEFLNTALNAVNGKAGFKQSKDKIEKAASGRNGGGTTNVFTDRETMLAMLKAKMKEPTPAVEGDFIQVDPIDPNNP